MRLTLGKAKIETDKPWKYYTGHGKHASGHYNPTGKYHIGPGGIDCPCCTMYHPTKLKRKLNRYFRRKAKQEIMSEANRVAIEKDH